ERARAFFQGLATSLDCFHLLKSAPKGEAARELERLGDAAARDTPAVSALAGSVSIRRRNDHARHFIGSAVIAATVSAEFAERVGLAKEASDAGGDSGFSVRDYS